MDVAAVLEGRVPGPSRVSYQFSSPGTGLDAAFEIVATADYDSATRKYTLAATVAPDGTVVAQPLVVVDAD